MSRNNRFRFSYQDLSRIFFEKQLNEQKIAFRVEEQLDNYAIPGTPLYTYYVSDEDYPKTLEVYTSIADDDDPAEYRKQLKQLVFFCILFILIWIVLGLI